MPQFLALKFMPVTVEQGKEVDLAVKVEKAVDFPGEAKVTLVGLPNKATTEPTVINKDSTDLVFHVKTDPASPPGETKSLFCQVVVMQNGEPITHNLGTGRLRIDAPLTQKKKAAPGSKPVVTVANAKPLSRLEKLRQESQERARAGIEQPVVEKNQAPK